MSNHYCHLMVAKKLDKIKQDKRANKTKQDKVTVNNSSKKEK